MMRITEDRRLDSVAQLRVEGDLTYATVSQLQASSEQHLVQHPALMLNVADLRYADAAGVEMLRQLVARGAVLLGCSGFLSESLAAQAPASTLPPTADAAEQGLLDRLQRGDDAAFEQLVRSHSARLLVTARRFARNEDDARDILQEAFLSAFKAIGAFNGRSKLSTWLHRIVVNAALMRARSRRRRPEESIDDLLPRFAEDGHFAADSQPRDLPTERFEQRETRQLVRRCIDALPETYREVLLLRDIEELNTEEVADLLETTSTAVKVRLHRARQALRALLEREMIR